VGDASVSQPIDTQKELIDARLLIEAMESEQIHLITELQHTQEENQRLMGMLSNKDKVDRQSILELQSHLLKSGDLKTQNMGLLMEGREDIERKVLQAKLDKMSKDLEEVRSLNNQYREDQAFHSSEQHQIELVCEQVEMETSRTILHLQEDVAALQLELHERFCNMTQENTSLRNTIAAKEEEIKALRMEWERATLELTSFLVDGSKSLKDASGQIEGIASSFPQASCCISEHVERAARVCMEKEESILLLEQSLEDAQMMVMEMELKLRSLKDATMALNEFQQLDTDERTEEAIHLSKLLYENTDMENMEDSECKIKKGQDTEAEQCANAAFLAGEWLSDCHKVAQRNDVEKDIPIPKLANPTDGGNHKISETKADTNVLALEYVKAQVQLARSGVLESENAINEFYTDIEMHVAALQIDVCKISSAYRELVQDLVEEIHETRKTYMEFRENHKNSPFYTVESPSMEWQKFLNLGNQDQTLTQIRDRLAETNDILNSIKDCINTKVNMCKCFSDSEDSIEADTWIMDCSISGSDVSTESVASGIKLDGMSCTSCARFPPGINMMDLKVEGGLVVQSDDQESEKSKKLLEGSKAQREATRFCLRKELDMAFHAFSKLYVHLTTLLSESDVGDCSYPEGMCFLEPLAFVNL
jgi:kinesin family protein 15